jgi:hypothetical protein
MELELDKILSRGIEQITETLKYARQNIERKFRTDKKLEQLAELPPRHTMSLTDFDESSEQREVDKGGEKCLEKVWGWVNQSTGQ